MPEAAESHRKSVSSSWQGTRVRTGNGSNEFGRPPSDLLCTLSEGTVAGYIGLAWMSRAIIHFIFRLLQGTLPRARRAPYTGNPESPTFGRAVVKSRFLSLRTAAALLLLLCLLGLLPGRLALTKVPAVANRPGLPTTPGILATDWQGPGAILCSTHRSRACRTRGGPGVPLPENSKFEAPNPKQAPRSEISMFKTGLVRSLGSVSDFEIRIWNIPRGCVAWRL